MKTTLSLLSLSTILLGVFFLFANISAQTKQEENTIKTGSVVSFEYTLSDDKGKVLESNKGKRPLTYTHGKSQIIPGLEKELAGMKVGGEKKVRVKPEEGYGPLDPKAFQEIPRTKVPPEAQKVGARLVATGPQGQGIPVRVHEVKEETVVIDFNHPMAGKTLAFDVKILEIKAGEIK